MPLGLRRQIIICYSLVTHIKYKFSKMNTVVEIRDDGEDVYLTSERIQMDRETRSEILMNIAGALLLISIVVIVFLLMSVRSTKIEPTNVPDFVLNIIPREGWKAQISSHVHTNLTLPVHRVLIGHTGFNVCCCEFDVCTQEIQKLQTFHITNRRLDDIGWNFMIGGDGTVYEGCGWDYEGFHTSGYNANSIGIAFIGNFSRKSPTDEHFKALHLLIEKGVQLKKIAQDYRLYAQRKFLPLSDSPGNNVINIIKNWPHFKYH